MNKFMKNKVIYMVQGDTIPPKYCCDGKEAVEKLEKLHKAIDAALEYVNKNYK